VLKLVLSEAVRARKSAISESENIASLQTRSLANVRTAMSNLVEALEVVRRLIELEKAPISRLTAIRRGQRHRAETI
jgi:hypothetical protein